MQIPFPIVGSAESRGFCVQKIVLESLSQENSIQTQPHKASVGKALYIPRSLFTNLKVKKHD